MKKNLLMLLIFLFSSVSLGSGLPSLEECKKLNKELEESLFDKIAPAKITSHRCPEALYIAFKFIEAQSVNKKDGGNPLYGYSYLGCEKISEDGLMAVYIRIKEVSCSLKDVDAIRGKRNYILNVDVEKKSVEFDVLHMKGLNWKLK